MTKTVQTSGANKQSPRLAIIWTRCELLFEQTLGLLVEATRTYEANESSLDAIRLEPRILLSATPIAVMVDADSVMLVGNDLQSLPVVAATTSNLEQPSNQGPVQNNSGRLELVVIDPRLADAQQLLDDLSHRSQDGTTFEILTLDVHRDGLGQITEALREHAGIDAIHIVTHGSDGRFLVGATLLSNENIENYAAELSRWQTLLFSDADILIYGCDVASTEIGQAFVARFATLTGTDVGASLDATGSFARGGDWELEFTVGQIQTDDLLSATAASQWSGLLQAITVTTTNDVVDGNTSSIAALLASRGADGFVSLREAIIAANGTVGGDVIFLSSGTYTLSIAGISENNATTGDLDIRDNLEIWGTGPGSTTIDGAGIDRVLEIRDDTLVTINDLTIRGGNAGSFYGGGIYVWGSGTSLTLQRVVVSNNTAQYGAGIYAWDCSLDVYNSTISSNTSTRFGGGIYSTKSGVNLYSSAILQNTATSSGGGIHNEGSGASLSLTNVTVTGNSTPGQGGGIYSKREATVVHSTITSNSAASGGGIYFSTTGTLSIQNSILAMNTGGNSNATLTGSLGHNLSDNISSGLTHPTDIIVADPKLGALGNYGGATQTIAILSGSAAIDAGAASGVAQFDQRGFARDTSADIGAFEYQRIASTGEQSINSTTASIQETSASTRGSQRAVAIASSGEHVVVWSSNQLIGSDGDGYGILMRRYSSAGTPISGEIQVNQFTTGDQRWATVAMDNAGNGVVVWTSAGQDGAGTGIYGRRFDQSGTFVGAEFRINTTTAGNQSDAAVAMNGTGQFIVVWQGNGSGDADGVFFRRFDTAGIAIDATEQLANVTDRGAELAPSVAINDAGQFAIGWKVGNDLYIRHFAANGTAVFADIQANSGLSNASGSSIGIDASGRTVIVYRTDGISGFNAGVWGRGFNTNGTQLHPWFQIAGGDATSPSIDMNADTSFIVVWNATGDSNGQAVMARQYDSNGAAVGAAFRVNATQSGDQHHASVAMLDSTNYVVAWSGAGPGDSSGVVARQFGTILPSNTIPVATNDSYTVDRGTTIHIESYPDWYDQSWQYRQLLTVPLTSAAVALVDHPVLVRLHASALDAINIDYSKIQNAGQDLRFVDGKGNLLAYQIESWDSAGYSQVWVKVPLLETVEAHNTFFMYYGNASAPGAQQPSIVWDADSVGVYHFNSTANDSSLPNQNGVATGIAYSTGIVGQAATFDGTNSIVNLGSDASLDNVFDGGGTISAWINPSGWGEGGFGRIVDKAVNTSGGNGFALQIAGTAPGNGQIIFDQSFSGTVGQWRTNPGTISLNSWQDVVVSYDSSSASNVPTIYINGIQQSLIFSSTPVGTASSDAAQDFTIGNQITALDRTFDGQIDEVRISTTIRDSDWVIQQYRTIVSAVTTSAPVQSRPMGLLVNDIDADNDPLIVTLVSGPTHAAAFTLNPDGSFTYQHNGDTAITDSFVYQLSDGQGGLATATANLSIQLTNTPPTISAIIDRTIAEDTSSGAIAFTIGDAESPLNNLVVTVSSNNQLLFANSDLVLSGSDANRQVTLTPLSNATGTAILTITVSDGAATTTRTFNVTVNAVNDAPTISAIADQSINEDSSSGTIAFRINDVDNAVGSLVVTGTSSNQTLIANAGIVLAGSGANRTIALTPLSNATGTAVITIAVSDGTATTTRTFNVTVNAVNDAPTISPIADQSFNEDTASGTITFTIGDVDNATGSLVVTATSSNQTRIANAGIVLGGSGANRTISITPQNNATGSAVITVNVSDGTTTTTRTLAVTITAVNDAPTISVIADQIFNEDTSSGAIAFTIGDVDNTVGSLVLTASSSNQSIINNAGIVLGGSGANRTISFTPQSNATGTSIITINVGDGTATATRTFNVTIAAINDAPTISSIANQSIMEDTSSGAIAFTVGDIDDAVGSLIVTATSSDTTLVANAAITFGGSGSNRTLSFTPRNNASGVGVITVTVSDGTTATTSDFNVIVNSVNDAPFAVSDSIVAKSSGPTVIQPFTLLSNDGDADGDAITFDLVSQPGYGTLTVMQDGSLQYDRTVTDFSSDTFSYRVFDGVTWSAPVNVTLSFSSLPPAGYIPQQGGTTSPSQDKSTANGDSAATNDSNSSTNDSQASTDTSDKKTAVVAFAGTNTTSNNHSVIDKSDSNEDLSIELNANRSLVATNAVDNLFVRSHYAASTRNGSADSFANDPDVRIAMATTFGAYDVTGLAITQPQLWMALESMKQEMTTSLAVSSGLTVGAAATTSVGMTVGYVVWVLRSGLLLSSVMAHLPMWRFMDPLAILDSSEAQADEDEETLGSIADGDSSDSNPEQENKLEHAELEMQS